MDSGTIATTINHVIDRREIIPAVSSFPKELLGSTCVSRVQCGTPSFCSLCGTSHRTDGTHTIRTFVSSRTTRTTAKSDLSVPSDAHYQFQHSWRFLVVWTRQSAEIQERYANLIVCWKFQDYIKFDESWEFAVADMPCERSFFFGTPGHGIIKCCQLTKPFD